TLTRNRSSATKHMSLFQQPARLKFYNQTLCTGHLNDRFRLIIEEFIKCLSDACGINIIVGQDYSAFIHAGVEKFETIPSAFVSIYVKMDEGKFFTFDRGCGPWKQALMVLNILVILQVMFNIVE